MSDALEGSGCKGEQAEAAGVITRFDLLIIFLIILVTLTTQ